MVKELIMDNMYNTGSFSDSMRGTDRFAFDSNEFQSIFDGKKDTQYMDYTENGVPFNKTPSNTNFRYSNNSHTADSRFNNKVSTNSTTISPENTPGNASAAGNINKVSGGTKNVESDGYSFSVRDSLQNNEKVINERGNKRPGVQQTDSGEKAEITASDSENISLQPVKQENINDVPDENADKDSANLSGNNTMLEDTDNDDTVDSGSEITNDTTLVDKESMNDIYNSQADIQNLVNDTSLLMYQTVQIAANIGTADIPEISAESSPEVFDTIAVNDANKKVLPEKELELSLQAANAIGTGQSINTKTGQTASDINIQLADDNADAGLRLQMQPDVNNEFTADRVKIDVLDYGLRASQVVEDVVDNADSTVTGISTVQNTEQVNQQGNTSGLLLNGNQWQILDESEQYEFSGNLVSNNTAEGSSSLIDNVIQQGTNTEISDSVDITDINQQTEVLPETDLNTNNLDIIPLQQAQEVDTEAEIQDTVSPVKIIQVNKNETANSVSIQDDGVETGAAANQVETTEQSEQNNSRAVNVSETEVTDSSELITDDGEQLDVKTQKQIDTDLRTITPDEQTDVDIEPDINVKVESKNNDLPETETKDEVAAQSTIEPESDNAGNENSNGANPDSTTSNNAKLDNTASEGQTTRQDFLSGKSSTEENIDMNIQERTRLAYVDMADTGYFATDDVIAQLESKFDGGGDSSEYNNNNDTVSVQSEDLTNYTDIDVEAADPEVNVTSLEDIVDEKIADELNITLKDTVSSAVKDGYSSTNSTTEQLIRYAIEGDTGFDTQLTSAIRQEVRSQVAGNTNSASREVLAQINEKLTTFSFKPGAKLTMQLNPEELGTVEIKLTNTLDGIRAEMTATSDDAGDMLNKHIDELKDTLQKYGVRLDRVAVSTNPSQQSSAQQDYTEQGNSQRQQQEQKQQHKEERRTQNFEDMVNSFFEEVGKE